MCQSCVISASWSLGTGQRPRNSRNLCVRFDKPVLRKAQLTAVQVDGQIGEPGVDLRVEVDEGHYGHDGGGDARRDEDRLGRASRDHVPVVVVRPTDRVLPGGAVKASSVVMLTPASRSCSVSEWSPLHQQDLPSNQQLTSLTGSFSSPYSSDRWASPGSGRGRFRTSWLLPHRPRAS